MLESDDSASGSIGDDKRRTTNAAMTKPATQATADHHHSKAKQSSAPTKNGTITHKRQKRDHSASNSPAEYLRKGFTI